MIREYFRSCLPPLYPKPLPPVDPVTSRDVQQLTAAMEHLATAMAILTQELHEGRTVLTHESVVPSKVPAPTGAIGKRKGR